MCTRGLTGVSRFKRCTALSTLGLDGAVGKLRQVFARVIRLVLGRVTVFVAGLIISSACLIPLLLHAVANRTVLTVNFSKDLITYLLTMFKFLRC